ncbi:hypothetical protein PR048_029275 [Dryococelus australis]|uniref:FHA domain-containing protein n=1 Tax=Dryococelus australis TaxID=614101 RepID=A0ABQ9GG04_9NEOP|nr:hypothetical protein PR048_029275 [Dryococelus australis]
MPKKKQTTKKRRLQTPTSGKSARAKLSFPSACSPPTRANRVQFPARPLPDFRNLELCRMMPLFGGFYRGYPISPATAFRRCSTLTSFRPHRLSRPLVARHPSCVPRHVVEGSEVLARPLIFVPHHLQLCDPAACVPCPHSSGVGWPTCTGRVASSRPGASAAADCEFACSAGDLSTSSSYLSSTKNNGYYNSNGKRKGPFATVLLCNACVRDEAVSHSHARVSIDVSTPELHDVQQAKGLLTLYGKRLLRADEGEVRWVRRRVGMQGRGNGRPARKPPDRSGFVRQQFLRAKIREPPRRESNPVGVFFGRQIVCPLDHRGPPGVLELSFEFGSRRESSPVRRLGRRDRLDQHTNRRFECIAFLAL